VVKPKKSSNCFKIYRKGKFNTPCTFDWSIATSLSELCDQGNQSKLIQINIWIVLHKVCCAARVVDSRTCNEDVVTKKCWKDIIKKKHQYILLD